MCKSVFGHALRWISARFSATFGVLCERIGYARQCGRSAQYYRPCNVVVAQGVVDWVSVPNIPGAGGEQYRRRLISQPPGVAAIGHVVYQCFAVTRAVP